MKAWEVIKMLEENPELKATTQFGEVMRVNGNCIDFDNCFINLDANWKVFREFEFVDAFIFYKNHKDDYVLKSCCTNNVYQDNIFTASDIEISHKWLVFEQKGNARKEGEC
jgi:hypothetical protein